MTVADSKMNVRRRLPNWMNMPVIVGSTILLLMVLAAICAPLIAPMDPIKQNILAQLAPPDAKYLLGADNFGRDTLSRLLFGARYSLTIGILSTALAVFVGSLIGMVAGNFGGRIDIVLMQVMDVVLAFPSLILGIALVAMLGATMTNIIIAIAFTAVPAFARIARSAVISVRDREFIQAARALGLSETWVLFRHILPNIVPEILVMASIWMATAVRTEASLAFIGLGIAPPAPTWGGMVRQGFENILNSFYLALWPSVAILILVLAFNMIGDGLRDAIDPRLRVVRDGESR
ncbi:MULTISPECIES: ABC transporter permease [Rhizobium/Agrobacterium group]|uniref:TM component of ABC transporter of mannopinic acid n=2 Tax=Rhizobium/Agrobacterium group TaxID=227290 RepID=K7XK15_AGRTU|nr:ABC transporter permease [Rhizobium rhizogenes]AFX65601.1 TM component of ABC transporter of mannopinic acid [Agrobacterium radiobacter]KEA03008.1 ABC transporter permease [Rhizobium rhizogenes]NTI38996.1 ABC transporter permease [Rhizobium rhizogenes]NTI85180.1 ABC transporter permease [Rhizobium rhizogenes]NTJ27366.1 ABC transporter permease [Rhizobium rhizogenes]